MPAGVGHGQAGPLGDAVLLFLLDHPGHEQDVVVLAHGHQDHEQEEADRPVEAAPGLGAVVERPEDQLGDAERGQVAEHDREDQVEADARAGGAGRRGSRRRPASPARTSAAGRWWSRVLRSLTAEVDPARPISAVPCSGLAAAGRGGQDLLHRLQRLEARLGERVGLEDDVEPGDVVQVGLVWPAWCSRTASRPPRASPGRPGAGGRSSRRPGRAACPAAGRASGPRRRPGWPAGGG